MAQQNVKKESRELTLGDDFGPAAISVNGIILTIDADGKPTLKACGDATIITNGNITIYSPDGNVTAYTNGTVQVKAPAPEQTNALTATVTEKVYTIDDVIPAYNIGDVLPDGWVVGPRSPRTGIVMSLEPASTALDGYKTWYQGEDHAKDLREQGHTNARQPSADNNNNELNAIYNEVVKAGRNGNAQLNTSDSGPYGIYWSSTTAGPGPDRQDLMAVQKFLIDGTVCIDYKDDATARVRCVRDELGITLA
jgi:hypothetical protein